jgi:hypothetical protein
MYASSLATIRSTPLLGLVSRYDESMVLFEHHLGEVFPGLDLSWQRQNSSGGENLSWLERRNEVERELEAVMDGVLASNQYDLQLYKEAEKQFERSLSRIPDLDQKLRNIRSRNSVLE